MSRPMCGWYISGQTDLSVWDPQQRAGPAVRDAMGYKLIVGDTGGGQGAWSAEQLPNASSSSCETEEDARVALPRLKTLQPLLYYLPSDAGEHMRRISVQLVTGQNARFEGPVD